MRLTLRTLLAYLDKTLAPDEAAFLDEKVKHSKVANALTQRISSTMLNSSLPSIRIDAQGTAGDANTVSEYLENTLDPNVVVDFEQACLSDDSRLAEVAACHQILAIVLRNSDTTSPSTKEAIKKAVKMRIDTRFNNPERTTNGAVNNSMMGISLRRDPGAIASEQPDSSVTSNFGFNEDARLEDAPQIALSEGTLIDSVLVNVVDEMHSPGFVSVSYKEKAIRGIDLSDASAGHVPDYLKPTHSGAWLNWLTTGGLIAALVILGWLSLGSIDSVRELFGESDQDLLADTNETKAPRNEIGGANKIVGETVLAVPLVNLDAEANASSIPPNSDVAVSVGGDPKIDMIPVASVDVAEPVDPAMLVPQKSDENLVAPVLGEPEVDSHEALATNLANKPLMIWQPETKSSSQATVLAMTPALERLPRLRLLAAGEGMQIGDHWIVPTGNRTDCWIEPGIRWKIADFSDLSLGQAASNKVASIKLSVGRALVAATPSCSELVLETINGTTYQIHFKDANSAVAIEVRYEAEPGLMIAANAAAEGSVLGMMYPVTTFTGLVGGATISLATNPEETLGIGETLTWYYGSPPERNSLESMPWWFKSATARAFDLEAAQSLHQLLLDWSSTNVDVIDNQDKERPLTAGVASRPDDLATDNLIVSKLEPGSELLGFLKAHSLKRTSPICALTLQILLLSGDYAQIAGTSGILSETSLRTHRAMLLETLDQSLGADPSREITLRDHVEEVDPARASRILELLSVPSNEQLEAGADRLLIDAISSPFLDERVLGIHQLSRIIGKDLGYQPDRPTSESIQTWKKQLNSGRIRWAKPKS